MAKNYTFTEMVKIIEAQKDLEAMAELGKRFPVLSMYVSKAVAKAPEEMKVLADCFPEHLIANKVNSIIKANLTGEASEDNSDDTEATEEKEATEGTNLEDMTTKELKSYARKLGVFKNAKSTRKEDLIAAIKNADATPAEDEDNSEDEETNPYEGKTAMELFKLCKSRNIKAEAKKPAKYYVDLLTKADEAAKAAEEEAEEDDWDDEEEEETPAPKKNTGKKTKANKNGKKTSKKTAPKKDIENEADEDADKDVDSDEDEDEWDI